MSTFLPSSLLFFPSHFWQRLTSIVAIYTFIHLLYTKLTGIWLAITSVRSQTISPFTSAKSSAQEHLQRTSPSVTIPFPSPSHFSHRCAYRVCSVRIAKDLQSSQLYAVKFIDKIAALNGNDPKSKKGQSILHQIASEVALHRTCAEHRNVIGFHATLETPIWRWIALEFAEGGDLFDKIGISHFRCQC